jgi:hypothetical protein
VLGEGVKRSGWFPRHTGLAPGGKPRGNDYSERHEAKMAGVPLPPIRRKKRSASEFARIYGSKARVEWIKAQPCLIARMGCDGCAGPIENAHNGTGGMGRKADAASIVPLCRAHHTELHREGAETFRILHNINLGNAAARIERAWRAYQERSEER